MKRDAFLTAIEQMGQPQATIDEIRDHLEGLGFWIGEARDGLIVRAQNAEIRRAMRQLKDEDKWPLFANLPDFLITGDGQRANVYKAEIYFRREDYIQVESYWRGRESYARNMRLGYEQREIEKFGPRS